jgi:hypothetical protein
MLLAGVAVLDCHSQLLTHPVQLDARNVIGPAGQLAKLNSVTGPHFDSTCYFTIGMAAGELSFATGTTK